MRQFVSFVQRGAYPLLIVSLSPLAAYFGALWHWTPGAASLAILMVPTCAAALSENKGTAFLTAALAGGGSVVEALLLQQQSGETSLFAFPLFAICVFFVASGVVTALVDHLRNRVETLEEQNTRYVHELYRRDREPEDADRQETESRKDASSQTAPERAEPTDRGVNYPMLLLTLQDVGRRISTSLDMETLLPTIVNTARTSLKCRHCQVYFWNAQEGVLENVLSRRQREAPHFVPQPGSGMTRWVLENRQILTRKAVEEDYNLRGLLDEEPHSPDAIAPLTVGGELLGLLVVDDVEQDSPTFVRLLYILANDYALGIKNAQLFQRIQEMARRDGLTGLLNHASFQQELQGLREEAVAAAGPLAIVMSDVDHFKKFNDTYGHQAGDYVLQEVARLWKAVMPDAAVLARYGGEEFIAALPGYTLAEARELAEMLREQIETRALDFEGRQLQVTASFGLTGMEHQSLSAAELIRRADEALYRAKQQGRNRVVGSPGPQAAATSSN